MLLSSLSSSLYLSLSLSEENCSTHNRSRLFSTFPEKSSTDRPLNPQHPEQVNCARRRRREERERERSKIAFGSYTAVAVVVARGQRVVLYFFLPVIIITIVSAWAPEREPPIVAVNQPEGRPVRETSELHFLDLGERVKRKKVLPPPPLSPLSLPNANLVSLSFSLTLDRSAPRGGSNFKGRGSDCHGQ